MSDDAASIITVSDLTKYYGKARGVKDLTFTVNRGEVFGFLGPNGAGKTSTIRMLLDLLRPTSGDIEVFGQGITEHSREIRRRCGYLPGSFSAHGHMTGYEFLAFLADMRRAESGLQAALVDRFHLAPDDLAKKTKHLSKGMLQKLGIIQAFAHEPELLILDEPTTGLDPLMQEEFYRLVHETRDRGATIFFSSHNLPEVEKVCHRIAIIREGELIALETLEGLKGKKLKRLKFTLSQPVHDPDLPGAKLVANEGLAYEYLVEGDVKALLRRLADLPVEDITFPEPDLEDVFMTYYRRDA